MRLSAPLIRASGTRRAWKRGGSLLLLTALYFAAGKFGLALALIHPSASAVWPPTGIALAALLLLGRRAWPAILAGAFLVNVTSDSSVLASVGIAVVNTLEAVTGAWLAERFAGGLRAFERPRGVFLFAVLAGLVATAVSAALGPLSLALDGRASWSRLPSISLTWWLGDAGGVLIVAPLVILAAQRRWRPSWMPARALEVALLFASLIFVGALVFSGWVIQRPIPIGFACVPALIWAAFRFGPFEAAAANLLLATIAVAGTLRGHGPFALESTNDSLLLLQSFLGIVCVTTLALAASVFERQRIEADLRRKTMELARSNAELRRSNEDLQNFAYAASHDLQEPLRMVSAFVQLLASRCAGQLDAEAHQFIAYAVEGAKTMQQLIGDLLAYSRVQSSEATFDPTDLNPVFDDAVGTLRLAIQESGARVTRASLPTVPADRVQMLQLLQNLIANAIKYRREASPEVRVEAREENEHWIVSVRDNGIGIESAYFERIFMIFKRLHGRDYPGTGVGLAICKRIVERHGGRIWVESQPGSGSTFHFALPKKRPNVPDASPAAAGDHGSLENEKTLGFTRRSKSL